MIKVLNEECINCNICKEKCPFNAIDIVDNKIHINSNCKECLVCVKSCPKKAIIQEINKVRKKKTDDNYDGVCVYGEGSEGILKNVTYELLTKGRELADELETKLSIVIVNKIEEEELLKLQRYGVDEIIKYNYLNNRYNCDVYAQILEKFILKYKPDIFLFPATDIGRELAPFIASRCNTGITADCTKLEIDKDKRLLKQTRPTFGGKMLATITIPNNKPQMCTVREGVLENKESRNKKNANIINEKIDLQEKMTKIILSSRKKRTNKEINLSKSEIIVAGGMGLRNKNGFELLKKLADILGGEIATTRACVEAGWIDKKYQIGQTGVTVKPKIYIACGISGAIQHIAGIKNSNYIIAINNDKTAPIFKIADYGIVGDLYTEIPKIIEKLGGKT